MTGGRIELDGQNLLDLGPAALRDLRAKRISMIFQEPMTALNPVMKVGPQIEEVLDSHTALPRREKKQRVLDIMEQVHLARRGVSTSPIRTSSPAGSASAS